MEPQRVDMGIGEVELGDVFAGEIGGESALPELVFALDFPLGLGCWGIQEANVIELERPAELGQGFGIFREKDGVIINVDLQWPAVRQESGREKIQVGQEEFSPIKFGADEHTAAIVEHIEHGKIQPAWGKPAMGRGVQLPEFTDLGALPAAHWGVRAFGRSRMRTTVFQCPAADLGAVEFEAVVAEGFGGRKAVGARRRASQAFLEEVGDWLGPSGGVVATRNSWDPRIGFLSCAGAQVIGGKRIEATAGHAELCGRFGGRQGLLPEGSQHMADERRRVAIS